SLGDSCNFNEIRAAYRQEERLWRLEIRTVSVEAHAAGTTTPSARRSAALMLLNPTRDSEQRAHQLVKQTEASRKLADDVQEVLRLFAGEVLRAQKEDPQGVPLPQTAMQRLERVIQSTILGDFDTRVRLLLKDNRRALPQLTAMYLALPTGD